MKDNTMFEQHTELNIKNELGMFYCGKRINTPNHEYGPDIRDHYLFVLVNKGEAVMLPDKKIRLKEHDLLVMQPDERIHYKSEGEWSISWLGLYGKTVSDYMKLLKITPQNPVMNIPIYNELKSVMDNIYDLSKDMSLPSKLSVTGLIYDFFSVLFKCANYEYKTDLAGAAAKIIDYNYCTDISVGKIAEYFSVDSAYFSRIFAKKMNMSPKKYIVYKRIERAKELLSSTDASVFEISNSVGYEDQFYFYRIFKKYTNLSPSEYRNKNRI